MRWPRELLVRKEWGVASIVLLLAVSAFAAVPDGPKLERPLAAGALNRPGETLPTIVLFEASWCPVCRQLERKLIPSAEVLPLADRFRWVVVDFDRDLSIARQRGVRGVPLILVRDAAGVESRRWIAPDAGAVFAERLGAYLENPGEAAGAPDVGQVDSKLIWTPQGYRSLGLCFAHIGYGPLHLASQSPLQSIRWSMLPRTPSTLGRGQYEVLSSGSWVNVWAIGEGLYELDYESLRLDLELAYGITDHLSIEAELEDRSMFGGRMDGLIRNFHDLFGIDQNGRDEVTPNRFYGRLSFDDQPPILLEAKDRGSFSRTLRVTLAHNLTCGTQYVPALSYAVTARYEMLDWKGNRGPGGVDFGVSVALAQRFGRVYVYLTLGYAFFGAESLGPLQLKSGQYTVLLAGEWNYSPRHALVVNLLRSEGAAQDYGAFSDPSTELTFGWKWELYPKTVLELGLIENIWSFDNSPDFGLHLGLSRRF